MFDWRECRGWRARHPRRPPQVAQHLGAGGQSPAHELLVLRRFGFGAELLLLIEDVELFDQRVRASYVVPDLLTRFGDHALLADERRHVTQLNMRLHIEFFEPVMDPLIVFAREDGIAFRIVSGPSIEMNRGVERVGRDADVMAQDAGVIDNALFDPFALVRIALGAPQAELDAQALKKFEYSEWN